MGAMKHDLRLDRRKVLIAMGASVTSASLLSACGGGEAKLACAGPDQLTASQKSARDGRKYVEASGEAGKSCANCTFFKSPGSGCGTCAIDNLPANPEGYCSSWVQMEESNGAEG